MNDDVGALPVRAAGHVGVLHGLDQAHERVGIVRERRRLNSGRLSGVLVDVVVVFPVGDQRIPVRCRAASNFAASTRGNTILSGGVLIVTLDSG